MRITDMAVGWASIPYHNEGVAGASARSVPDLKFKANTGEAMPTCPRKQRGGSTVFTIIIVAILGYGAFIGIQYVPQWTEARSVQSILDSLAETQRSDPAGSQQDIEAKVIRMLQVNEMNDMVDAFKVTRTSSGYTVRFEYERELNLGWEKRTIHYDRLVEL